MQLAQLGFADRGGRVDHEVDGFGGLGEGDDFAEAGSAGEDHDQAVEAEGDAAVGRSAVLQGFEEEAEALLCLFVGHAEGAEDVLLDVKKHWAIRFTSDWQPTHYGFSQQNEFAGSTGIVYKIGKMPR